MNKYIDHYVSTQKDDGQQVGFVKKDKLDDIIEAIGGQLIRYGFTYRIGNAMIIWADERQEELPFKLDITDEQFALLAPNLAFLVEDDDDDDRDLGSSVTEK